MLQLRPLGQGAPGLPAARRARPLPCPPAARNTTVRPSNQGRSPSRLVASASRGDRALAVLSTFAIEWAMTGGLLWAPLLWAVFMALSTPGREEAERTQQELIQREVEKVRQEALARVPVTPRESAEWMNRIMAEIWAPFVVPMVMKENLSGWQDKISAGAPPGWSIELVEFSMGTDAPSMSNYQVFNDTATGRVFAMDCDMALISKSMRVVVRGTGPVGQFVATVSNFAVRGSMRILPIPGERMMLWSYKRPPDADFRLQVRGPVIGERELPQFAFIRAAFAEALRDSLVEPRRAAASLDYEYTVQQAVDTMLVLNVASIDDLFPPTADTQSSEAEAGGAASTTSSTGAAVAAAVASVSSAFELTEEVAGSSSAGPGTQARRRLRGVVVVVTNLGTKLQRRLPPKAVGGNGAIQVGETLKMAVGDKEGIFLVQVREAGRASGRVLGRVQVHVAATKDGSTLMWALGEGGRPLAKRWSTLQGPWKITLPLEEPAPKGATITLSLATDPWVYREQQPPAGLTVFRTPGPRTVVLQVMEARDLAAKTWGGTPDPYVQLAYNGRKFRTRTVYSAVRPLWNQTFVFAENASPLARRITLDVYDSGVSKDDTLGITSVSLDIAAEGIIQDRWLQLSGAETGEVRVRMAVVPGTLESPAVEKMVGLFVRRLGTAEVPTLQVVVLSARNLMARPASGLMGQRNAYVNVLYNGARQVTPVIKQNNNPVWNFAALFPFVGSTKSQRAAQREAQAASASTSSASSPAEASVSVDATPTSSTGGLSSVSDPPSGPSSSSQTGGLQLPAGLAGLTSGSLAATFGNAIGNGNGLSKSNRPPKLRLEVKDVDPVPPDDDLGYVEVDVSQILAAPGAVWEQWLPLQKGRGGEVLVRLARLDPSAPGNTTLALPRAQQAQQAQQQVAQGAPAPLGTIPEPGASAVGGPASPLSGVQTITLQQPGLERVTVQQVLLDNFSEQVRTANEGMTRALTSVHQPLMDMREALGTSWIPKVQTLLTSVGRNMSLQPQPPPPQLSPAESSSDSDAEPGSPEGSSSSGSSTPSAVAAPASSSAAGAGSPPAQAGAVALPSWLSWMSRPFEASPLFGQAPGAQPAPAQQAQEPKQLAAGGAELSSHPLGASASAAPHTEAAAAAPGAGPVTPEGPSPAGSEPPGSPAWMSVQQATEGEGAAADRPFMGNAGLWPASFAIDTQALTSSWEEFVSTPTSQWATVQRDGPEMEEGAGGEAGPDGDAGGDATAGADWASGPVLDVPPAGGSSGAQQGAANNSSSGGWGRH